MTTQVIDTNIIVRFLTKDNPLLFSHAQNIFKDAQSGKYNICLDELVLAETIWVLISYYHYTKTEVCPKLIKILSHDWVTNPRKNILLNSLVLYSLQNFSFVDCWAYCLAQETKLPLLTFDKKLKKLKI